MSESRITWEQISLSGGGFLSANPAQETTRTPVPGGWIVRFIHFGGRKQAASAIVFVPDPRHAWKIENYPTTWEPLHHRHGPNDSSLLLRLKVLGGWIVKDSYYVQQILNGFDKVGTLSLTLVFVADKKHVWTIDNVDNIQSNN